MARDDDGNVWAWDIEADDWDSVRCVVARSLAGDVERFAGPRALERMSDVMDRARGQWGAHAAGIYDTLLMSNVRPPWDELVMSGAAVLCARSGTLKLRDTFRWWLSPLSKVGQYLEKLEAARPTPRHPAGYWLKRDVDRTRIKDLTDAEVLDYCESDVTIELGGIVAALDYLDDAGAERAWTAGASALKLLQVMEPAAWRLLERHALTLETATAAGDVVRGARVENWARGVVDGVYSYDFKSAYPAAYAFRELPIGARRAPATTAHPGAVIRCRWFWPWRDQIPPVLDELTGAGAGWCEAWCVPDEVDLLRRCGARHLERLAAWEPAMMVPIGQIFARRLYKEKEAGSFFGKVFLNSLHGKFSESPIKDFWRLKKPEKWYGPPPTMAGPYWRGLEVDVDKRGRVARHIQPLAAAHILGRTRARLTEVILAVQAAGGRVFYCDTDSVHCDLPPERMPVALGGKLGELAPEGGPFVGIYVAPKTYALCDPTSGRALKGAGKGIPWGSLKDGVRTDGATGAVTYRQARDKEQGADHRRRVYEEALEGRVVAVVKEGITSWATGVGGSLGWHAAKQARTVRPVERNKAWKPGGAPTTWAYRTPDEVLTATISDGAPAEIVPTAPDYSDPWS